MANVNADFTRGAIHVDGLGKFMLSLKAADPVAVAEMKRLVRDIGDRVILPEVEMLVNYYLSTKVDNVYRRKGSLENSPRARATAREGRIFFGMGRSTDYAAWWEFGGSTKAPRGGQRLVYKAGRTLYPALRAKRSEVEKEVAEALDKVAVFLNGA